MAWKNAASLTEPFPAILKQTKKGTDMKLTTKLAVILCAALLAVSACAPSPKRVSSTAPPRVDIEATVAPGYAAAILKAATGVEWHGTDWGAVTTGTVTTGTARRVHGALCATDWGKDAVLFEGTAHKLCERPQPAPEPAATAGGTVQVDYGAASMYDERGVLAFPRYRSPIGCAHKTIDPGTHLIVRYRGRTTECVVDDRGPYVPGRKIDLQPAQFADLGPLSAGVLYGVSIEVAA